MKRLLLLAVAAIPLSGCSTLNRMAGMGHGAMAGPPMPMAAPTPGMIMPTQANAYLRAAGESDIYEITSSQLALQRTQNPEIRAYATKLIDHHTGTTNATLAAAKAGRVLPPPAVLGPQKRAMVQQLEGQTGAAFDQLYIRQQVSAHQEALALHTNYARAGDVASLRASAGAAVPIVTDHLAEAGAMQSRMGGQTGVM